MAIQVAAQQFALLTSSKCAAWRSVAGEIDANAIITRCGLPIQIAGRMRHSATRIPIQPPTTRSMSSPASFSPVSHRIVIQGVMLNGRAFRPSDWADRLCGVMSSFGGDRQMRYSPYVRPLRLDGVTCVVVEPSLQEVEPRAYRFLLDFAHDNELVVIDPTVPGTRNYCPVPGSALDTLAK